MRLISVNGETAVHHVDERPWKCTIRLLSGSSVKLPQRLFYTRACPRFHGAPLSCWWTNGLVGDGFNPTHFESNEPDPNGS